MRFSEDASTTVRLALASHVSSEFRISWRPFQSSEYLDQKLAERILGMLVARLLLWI